MQSTSLVIALFEFVLLIFSLSVHECAHAWTASRLGDQTARLQGRITLNPMYHVDPVGTLLLPALLIFGPLLGGSGMLGGFLVGWAKPTPVITRNFRNIRRDDMLVCMAGPCSNLLLAGVGVLGLMALLATHGGLLYANSMTSNVEALWLLCKMAVVVNLALFFFNLIPIPPLDGHRVVRQLLPYNALGAFDRIGMVSYVLMLVIGGPVVRVLMVPALRVVNFLLSVVPH